MEDKEKDIIEEEKKEELKEQSLQLDESITGEIVDKTENTEEENQEETIEPMESVVEVDTEYDYKTLKYCNMYVIRIKRKSRLIYSVMAAISFIIGILCFVFMEDINRYIGIIIFALGIWTLVSLFTEESKIDKSLETYFKTHAPFVQHFAFNHEKIRVTAIVNGEERTGDYPWAYIQEIHAIPEYFFLFLNGGTPIVIDRDSTKITKGTTEDLEQIIKEQTALKPFNQYDGVLVKNLKDIKYYQAPEESTATEVKDDPYQIKEESESTYVPKESTEESKKDDSPKE